MKLVLVKLLNFTAGLLPDSLLFSTRLLLIKTFLIAFALGFIFAFPIAHFVKKFFTNLRNRIKESRRNRRLSSRQVPNGVCVGEVTDYLDKIGVAIVKLSSKSIRNGETILFLGNGTKFAQKIGSLQINHKPVEEAKKGQEAGLKVDQPCRKGDLIYKMRK